MQAAVHELQRGAVSYHAFLPAWAQAWSRLALENDHHLRQARLLPGSEPYARATPRA